MLIRKNTKEYKVIGNIIRFHATKNNSIREKNIILYIVESGKALDEKIPISSLAENKDVYYEMTYGTILESFDQPNYQLHQSDDDKRLYFFRNTNNKDWDQTPFEISEGLHSKLQKFKDIVIEPAKQKEITVKVPKIPKENNLKPPIKMRKSDSTMEKEALDKKAPLPPAELPKKLREEQKAKVDYRSKEWLKVGSEGIEAFKYLFDRKMLYIVYRPESSCYVYYNVSKADFIKILSQEHMATYINQQFKGKKVYDFVGKVAL